MIQDYLKDITIEINPHSLSDKDKFIFTATLGQIAEKCKDKDRRYELVNYTNFLNQNAKAVYSYNNISHDIIIKNDSEIPLINQNGFIEFFNKNEKFVLVDIDISVHPFRNNDIAIKYYKGELI